MAWRPDRGLRHAATRVAAGVGAARAIVPRAAARGSAFARRSPRRCRRTESAGFVAAGFEVSERLHLLERRVTAADRAAVVIPDRRHVPSGARAADLDSGAARSTPARSVRSGGSTLPASTTRAPRRATPATASPGGEHRRRLRHHRTPGPDRDISSGSPSIPSRAAAGIGTALVMDGVRWLAQWRARTVSCQHARVERDRARPVRVARLRNANPTVLTVWSTRLRSVTLVRRTSRLLVDRRGRRARQRAHAHERRTHKRRRRSARSCCRARRRGWAPAERSKSASPRRRRSGSHAERSRVRRVGSPVVADAQRVRQHADQRARRRRRARRGTTPRHRSARPTKPAPSPSTSASRIRRSRATRSASDCAAPACTRSPSTCAPSAERCTPAC